MIDLLRYPSRSGGINNIATVLAELVESVDENKLIATITEMQVELVILQRLGYLLEFLDAKALADALKKFLQPRKLRTRPLVSGMSTKGCKRNLRWELYINYEVESDV